MTASPTIAFFVGSLRCGGAVRTTLTLARTLAERGVRVDLVAAHADGPLRADVAPGIRVVDLHAERVITSVRALRRYLRESRPSVLMSVTVRPNVGAVFAVRGLRGTVPRVVVTEHGMLSRLARLRPHRNRLLPLAARIAYRHADAVVAVSEGVADDLAAVTGLPRSRIHVLRNAVVSGGMIARAREAVDHEWVADRGVPLVVFVGRLQPPKDLETLAEAFAQLRRRRPCRLIVVGDGAARPALVKRLAELGLEADTYLPGAVANPYPYIRAADVLALASLTEGMPTVLIEALALGTPVVASDCAEGLRGLLAGGDWGTLVPPAHAGALADALDRVIDRNRPPIPDTVWRLYDAEAATDGYLSLLLAEAA